MNQVIPTDLQTYLGLSDINVARAQMLINDALAQAAAVVTVGTVPDSGPTWANLPNGAEGVIRSAVARQYQNTGGATTETVGPYSVTRPAPSGSMFSAAEIATLERLAGSGGAFTVDPTPDDAATGLYPWDLNIWGTGLGYGIEDEDLTGMWQ